MPIMLPRAPMAHVLRAFPTSWRWPGASCSGITDYSTALLKASKGKPKESFIEGIPKLECIGYRDLVECGRPG